MTIGINLDAENIPTLTSTTERNDFIIKLKTNDPTTAQVIHGRITLLIANLGDTAEVDVQWARTQTKHLDNAAF